MPRLSDNAREPEGEFVPCVDCRRVSARRLPERFPHICTSCLFPHDYDSAMHVEPVSPERRHARVPVGV